MRPFIDLFELSRRMGHSTYRLTADLYTHVYEEENPERAGRIAAAFGAATPTAPVVPLRTG